MKNLVGFLLVLVACGGGGSGSNSDAPEIDAPVVAPTMVKISGTATSRGLNGATPEAGVTIAAFANSDENTPLAMATTDAAGAFTLNITTTGTAISGYLQATKNNFITSYLYPPTPIAGDLAMVPMNMISVSLWDTFSTLAGGGQTPANGLVAMIVVSGTEPTSPPVAGATISSSPASMTYRYNNASGLPNPNPTSTNTDGIGYAFNAPVGPISVTASKSGSTFKTTMLKARANQLTQTLVIQ